MNEIEILKLDLLEIQNLECKTINSLIMISRKALELFLHQQSSIKDSIIKMQ